MSLTEREKQCFSAWSNTEEEYDVLSFKQIAASSGLDPSVIRRHVRALARKGYTVFARGCMTEDGEVAGSGYALTKMGREAMYNGSL